MGRSTSSSLFSPSPTAGRPLDPASAARLGLRPAPSPSSSAAARARPTSGLDRPPAAAAPPRAPPPPAVAAPPAPAACESFRSAAAAFSSALRPRVASARRPSARGRRLHPPTWPYAPGASVPPSLLPQQQRQLLLLGCRRHPPPRSGQWRRKLTKIKKGLSEKAKVKKAYAKLK